MSSTLFTYPYLATFAGATAATALVVASVQGLPGLRSLSPRLLAYLVAVVVLGLARVYTGPTQWSDIPLLLLNALLVASSAIGASQVSVETLAALRRRRPTA